MPTDMKPTGTFTKADLVETVREQVGLSRRDAFELVEAVLEILKTALANGERVKVTGFGTFSVHFKAPRVGRNPVTDEAMVLSARRVLRFRPSMLLRRDLNERFVEDGGDG